MSKAISSRGFLGDLSDKFADSLMKYAALFAGNVLAPFAPMTSTSTIDGGIQRTTVENIM